MPTTTQPVEDEVPPGYAPRARKPRAARPVRTAPRGTTRPPEVHVHVHVHERAARPAYRAAPRRPRKRNNPWVHFWLFLFTAGVGNAFYAWYVADYNRDR